MNNVTNNSITGSAKIKHHAGPCAECELVVINGHRCHEHGCPAAWRDTVRECKNCDTKFSPEYKEHDCCDKFCSDIYYNQGGSEHEKEIPTTKAC